jgi:sorting nexin-27
MFCYNVILLQVLIQKYFSWCSQYLRLARELTGYGEVVFPHCSCDSRKEGHVVASVGAASFKLQACREDGALEVKGTHF